MPSDRSGKIITGSIQGGVHLPQAALANVSAWQNIALPADTVEVVVYGDQTLYCICNTTATSPILTGPVFPASVAHRLPCYGCTYIHLNKIGSNVNISWTAITRA